MFDPARHLTPAYRPWDAAEAATAIREIAADALATYDARACWPTHPMDDHVEADNGTIYFGAAGVIWALNQLARTGAIPPVPDLAPLLPMVREQNAAWYAREMYPSHASLLMGDLGVLLVQMRLAPSPALADRIHDRAAANGELPTVELMWGLPGSMLACLHMQGMTGEARFRTLFQAQATRLLAELEPTEHGLIWTQQLYGKVQQWLGPVHGFAGHMAPLLRGWDWLDAGQQAMVAASAQDTLAAHAVHSPDGATWPATVGRPAPLCQHCHGAPGMVTVFADARFSTPAFERLLLDGGALAWAAGPLAKGSNLCHGTGGNGYAFLKLHRRTGDPLWLDRARAFAMVSIDQVRAARAEYGHGRYSLWTGDPGLALYLQDCLAPEVAAFPTVDVF